jgi:hypothetical protein
VQSPAPQILQLRNKGLFTAFNSLSAVPPGALLQADNCIIDENDILESRRGFDRLAQFPNSSDRAYRYASYQSRLIAAYGSGGLAYYQNGWQPYGGTYASPDSVIARLRFLEAASNLYFTTSAGIYKLDTYNGTPVQAGVPTALDVNGTLQASVSGFMTTNNQVAYRVTWGIKDANQNIDEGAPSGRFVITNSSGSAANVQLTITIPQGITTAHFFKVNRTALSGGSSIDPGDEEGLVYEGNATSGQIAAGTLTVTDATPDSLRGASLYTNQSQQGIKQANYPPPLALDFATFRNFTFYANTTSKQRLTITLLSVGSPSGIQSGDVITIGGTAYTADTTENAATGHFAVASSGTIAQNIASTANSLVRVINQYAGNTTVYASYLSGVNDLPGMIGLEERGIGGAAFSCTASAHGSAVNPALPTSGTSVQSTNNRYLNGLMVSKEGQPEAVPLVNQYFVGSANNRILRILPLRDSLFIFKEREGIYQLTGYDTSTFIINLFDSSTRLLAPDSAVVLNNQIWALTDQGVTSISETAPTVTSRPIEDQILTTFGQSLPNVKQYDSGIAYETDRKYILLSVTSSSDLYPTQAFVFNTFTQNYTRWPLAKTCGFVNPVDNKLYLGDALSNYTNVERKNLNYTDYCDEGIAYTISSSSGTKVYLTSTNEIAPGDALYQSASVQSIITDVQPAYVTVQDQLTWAHGAVTVYRAIDCQMEWAPITGQNPGVLKQFPEISFLFRQSQFNTVTASFRSDLSTYYEPVPLSGNRTGLWGLFPWGQQPWGGVTYPRPLRTLIPREKQWASQLSVKFQHRQAFGLFSLQGLSLPIAEGQSFTIAK